MIYRNVFAYKRGSIFDENGKYIPEASGHFATWNKYKMDNFGSAEDFSNTVKHHIKKGDYVKTERANYVYGFSVWRRYSFGHIFDVLQPLKEIEELNIPNGKICLNGQIKHLITKDFDIHLGLFGYSSDNILSFDLQKKPVFFDTLYSIHPKEKHGDVSGNKIEWLRSKYRKFFPEKDEEYKIYLSRGCGKYIGWNKRKVKNEKDIVPFLKQHGFIILDGTEGLENVVRCFSGAKIIIGAHSAAFRNILFCRNNPDIFEFYPDNWMSPGKNAEFGKVLGITNYNLLPIEGDEETSSIEIPIDYLKSIV